MTNKQRWDSLTEALESPQDFIDISWYWTVATALERRVWIGDISRAMFCNLFILFIGPPGIGKGTSMREGNKLLSKYGLVSDDGHPVYFPGEPEPAHLFHRLPDTTTFEELAHSLANCSKVFKLSDTEMFSHSSAYFFLEELSSLLRKNKSDDISRFLLNLYDCVDHKYKTRKAGTAVIKRGCLNFIAGTQLDFIRKAEKDGLLGEGLFSRFIMVYCTTKRQVRCFYADLTDEQKAHQVYLQEWCKRLSKLSGRVEFAPGVQEYMEEWWKSEDENLQKYNETKLAEYLSRRKEHVMKLAVSIHFSESLDLIVTRENVDQAIALLRKFESGLVNMASRSGRNQIFPIQERLINALKQREMTQVELYQFLGAELDYTEILSTIQYLTEAARITFDPIEQKYKAL